MERIFEELAQKIFTKEELLFLIGQINLVEKLIFKNIDTPLSERVRGKISQDFQKEIENLERKKIISENPEANQIFFENFKKYLQNLPQMRIVIAFEPRPEFIKKIILWLREELKQKVILDLILNSEIVGGAIIEYQGKELDFSIAKKIDEIAEFKL